MITWLQEHGASIEGRTCFEIGTGHKPTLPIVFFLAGAKSITTVDLHPRLDLRLLQEIADWFIQNRNKVAADLATFSSSDAVNERLDIIAQHRDSPAQLLEKINVKYLAPADAAASGLPDGSIDFYFSTDVLEHIEPPALRSIMRESTRLLSPSGIAIHFVNTTDHFSHQDEQIPSNNFLKFSESEWDKIAGNEFSYCNRLRPSVYRDIFAESGLQVDRWDVDIDERAVAALDGELQVHADFSAYPAEDLATREFRALLTVGAGEQQ